MRWMGSGGLNYGWLVAVRRSPILLLLELINNSEIALEELFNSKLCCRCEKDTGREVRDDMEGWLA